MTDPLENLKSALKTANQVVKESDKTPQVESEAPVVPQEQQGATVGTVETGEVKKKHPGGRPMKFKTVEAMEKVIRRYFKECLEPEPTKKKFVRTVKGKKKIVEEPFIPDPQLPTMTGLALALGISRKSLVDYSERDEFCASIMEAKQFVESLMEKELARGTGQVTGIMFNLKNNYGWTDEHIVDNRNTNVNDILDRIEKGKKVIDAKAEEV